MLAINPNGYFITGSDTDVGKTYIACEIVRQLRRRDIIVETRKPAESGCEVDSSGNLKTHDAQALCVANANRESIERVARYRYQAALAPHIAARIECEKLELKGLLNACTRDKTDSCLIVEGAGGFYSPLAEDALNADLASALQLPVIIVVNDRIGAVNQALMTIQAVSSRDLAIAAIILNQLSSLPDDGMDNVADLKTYCKLPIFSCRYRAALASLFEES
jgi:dethiobiotin synthetase